MCFNAKGDWVPAAEPMHKDVDLRKQNRCGVGPGLVSSLPLENRFEELCVLRFSRPFVCRAVLCDHVQP